MQQTLDASAELDVLPGDEPGPRVIVVDDDAGIRHLAAEFLQQHGYRTRTASNATGLEKALSAENADLVVLDVMLPGEDGLSICRRLFAKPESPAVIILSARGDDTDRIVGLELGADDYLAKPCNPRELLARVRAVLRRRGEVRSSDALACEFDGWSLDLLRRELRTPQAAIVNLSAGEFALLRAFVERPQRVLTRDQLLDLARGPDSEAYDRAVDVQISRLRRKLADGDVAGGELIRTLRNEGYMFTARVHRR